MKVCSTNSICDSFAENFDTVYDKTASSFNYLQICTEKVVKAINSLKDKTSLGPDGLHARLKKVYNYLNCFVFYSINH